MCDISSNTLKQNTTNELLKKCMCILIQATIKKYTLNHDKSINNNNSVNIKRHCETFSELCNEK